MDHFDNTAREDANYIARREAARATFERMLVQRATLSYLVDVWGYTNLGWVN